MERPSSISTTNIVLVAVVVLAGVVQAALLSWTCDDAFISYRYAENLVHGHGLVFNAGERVEGYSNFLWTMWIALGMRLGAEPERWSIAWGLAFHAGTLALLGWRSIARARTGGAKWVIPIALLVALLHEDWNVHATSGLETSLFLFLVLAGFLVTVDATPRPDQGVGGSRVRLAVAGMLLGLASLTRPDGALFAAVTGAWLLLPGGAGVRGAAAFGAAFAAVFVPHLLWRHAYYGDWVPNTYYAKSAQIPWVEQGLTYARLYFQKYGMLLAGPLLGGGLLLARRARLAPAEASRGVWGTEGFLALALAAAHVAYVIRIGGDFMYARMLLPATPLLLVVLESSIVAWVGSRPAANAIAAAAVMLAVVLPPHPLPGRLNRHGIVNERAWYDAGRCQTLRLKGEALRVCFEGLPVRAAFIGAEARVVFYSKVPVAIECSAGLTDRTIARQPLRKRGRIGHEKHPSVAYLLDVRGVQVAFFHDFARQVGLGDSLATIPVRIGSARFALLRSDPVLIAALVRHGAEFPGPARPEVELLSAGDGAEPSDP